MSLSRTQKARIVLAVAALGIALANYLVPLVTATRVDWIRWSYHPEWYMRAGLVFTGYIYPSVLIALFALVLLPAFMPRLESRPPWGLLSHYSLFVICLASLLSLVYLVWSVTTPMF